ncbi:MULTISPECIES: hypothetical protein [Mycobacterium]|uniref:Uncharacterized protein n=1 Tax=Mycobacterium kiyosense TaxID=2871094 RepID=A0A9P3QD40_9MYCO|nr:MULTISPECIES: hypothetical protein [Mycobacterium]BDB43722.1 hypothetical protein IWGMT90018_41680 [Mycobacterium kiyosense]BDE15281.1 hypothetical protein MKCMC460_41410 [Mycobacterium sp. 20KCMC460]GLB84511.1 hypothetical protein SRL2020028_37670 [Mycobacterium kiyosense]GLB91872.1 hypothetical protein SRL2020130_46890 [Mycobacterium kiyosense]GLB97945.1 hypothetical protein SRL2020226_47210 [Mycobacterium kiyosense]
MGTYDEYLSQGVDPATARAWADADAADTDAVDEAAGQSHEPRHRFVAPPLQAFTALSPETAAEIGLAPAAAAAFADTLQDLRLRTGPAPGPAIGRDTTGMVALTVDEMHTPLRLDLRNDWTDAVPAQALPTAIFGAYRAALDIQYQQARQAASDEPPPKPATLQDLVGPLDDYRDPPRPLARFREDVYAACDQANRLSTALASAAAARKAGGAPAEPRTIAVQLDGAWLVGCQINAEWAEQAAAARIMNEFAVALQQAKDNQAGGPALEAEKQALLAQLSNLTREGIAALQYLGER